jgi:hypothetical protein
MPRHEPHTGDPYTKLVAVMLNQQGLDVLDRLRGRKSRSAYLRDLIKAEARRDRAGNEMGHRA